MDAHDESMKEIMERLAILILNEMEKRNQSCLCFSELCGVGKDVVGGIINRKKKDVKLSTIAKICAYSDIRFEDIFSITGDCGVDKIINNAVLSINGSRYSMQLTKLNNI